MRISFALMLLLSQQPALWAGPLRGGDDDLGYQMLIAFAGERDYAKAEKLAKMIPQNDPLHPFAVRLAQQLPKRGDDFVKLKLPTPAEWSNLKKKMSRVEQID